MVSLFVGNHWVVEAEAVFWWKLRLYFATLNYINPQAVVRIYIANYLMFYMNEHWKLIVQFISDYFRINIKDYVYEW